MSDKFITESGLKTILSKLYAWFPFRKKETGEMQVGANNEDSEESVFSIGIGTPGQPKNAFEVQKDGDIYIYDNSGKKVKLQNELQNGGSGPNLTMEGYNELIIANEGESQTAYDIQEDDTVQLAIKKLDKRSDSEIVEKTSYLEFPTIGKRGVIYREKTTGKQFIWDSKNYGYIQQSCDVIFGGNASDFNQD